MSENNYNVKILVDVQGKKVMDALATGSGSGGAGGTKSGNKTLGGAIGAAKQGIMQGEGTSTVFATLTKSLTGLAAVMGLGVGVLLMAVGNSKILSTIFGTIGRLLGFLMDIILLPMMPIFMMLVRWLYMLIIQFRNFTKNLSLKSILDFGLNVLLLTSPVLWVVKLIQWALGDGNVQNALNFSIGVLQGAGDWLWDITKWLFFGTFRIVNSAVDFTLNIGSAILGVFAGAASLVMGILKYLLGLGSIVSSSISFSLLANPIGSIWSFLTAAWQTGLSITVGLLANPIGWVWSFLQSLWASGKGVYNVAASSLGLPKLDTGGTVLQTGVAVVHRGETYSGVNGSGQPANSTGGGNSYTFNNYGNTKSEYDLFLKFMDLMRQRGKGLTL